MPIDIKHLKDIYLRTLHTILKNAFLNIMLKPKYYKFN